MTNDKRYAPPMSDVADLAPESLLAARPQQVRVAVSLLWIAFGLGIVSTYLNSRQSLVSSFGTLITTITAIMSLIVYGCFALVNVMIFRGKDWARIVALVITLLSTAATIASVAFITFAQFQNNWILQSIHLVDLLLDFVALYLLFTKPGALWFKRPA